MLQIMCAPACLTAGAGEFQLSLLAIVAVLPPSSVQLSFLTRALACSTASSELESTGQAESSVHDSARLLGTRVAVQFESFVYYLGTIVQFEHVPASSSSSSVPPQLESSAPQVQTRRRTARSRQWVCRGPNYHAGTICNC